VNFFGIGGLELLIIGLVAFLVLGPKKMAEAGKTAAKILSELRKQRDELTAAIMSEEPAPPEGARREPEGAAPVARDRLGSGEPARPGELGPGQDAPATSARPVDRPTDQPFDRPEDKPSDRQGR
jgi:Sec-independent protein translocase protein TatA